MASSPKYSWTQLPIYWYGGGMEVTGWTGRCDATAHHLHRGVLHSAHPTNPRPLVPVWTLDTFAIRGPGPGTVAVRCRGRDIARCPPNLRRVARICRDISRVNHPISPSPLFVFVPLFAGDISDIFSLLATHCITLTEGTPVDTINTLVSTKTFYSVKNLILNSLSERRGPRAKAKCFSCVLYRWIFSLVLL